MKETGGVQGVLHGESRLSYTTTDIAEALGFSNILLLIVPAYAQAITFKSTLPYLTKQHVLVRLH